MKAAVLMLSVGASFLSAQTMIEYGASAGRSASAAAGAMGKSATGALGKVSQALAGAASASDAGKAANAAKAINNVKAAPPAAVASAPVVTVASAAPPAPKEEPLKPANLSALVTGMDRDDMLKNVGKPSMSLSSPEASTMVETCWYKSGSDNVTVTLRDGKVASISGLPKAEAK